MSENCPYCGKPAIEVSTTADLEQGTRAYICGNERCSSGKRWVVVQDTFEVCVDVGSVEAEDLRRAMFTAQTVDRDGRSAKVMSARLQVIFTMQETNASA